MSIELKEALEYMGIELKDDATIKEFKESFASVFTKTVDVPDKQAIIGEQTRKFGTELKRTAKENGLELSEDESKLPVAELSRLVASKITEANAVTIKELEAAKGKPNEALESLKEKYSTLESKLSDVTELKDGLATKLTDKEKEFTTFTKGYELTSAKNGMFNTLKGEFSGTADEMKREGFYAIMNGNYKMKLDENDKFAITDNDGKLIPNPDKHGEFLQPIDVYRRDMKEKGVYKEVDTTKRNTPPTTTTPPVVNQSGVRVGRPRAVRSD